jgi:hypothetical protein
MDHISLIEREMEGARRYWPQIYLSLRAYTNASFILPADIWRELAAACLGARIASAFRASTFPLPPPIPLIEEYLNPLLDVVNVQEGAKAAFITSAAFNCFLQHSTSMESAVCGVARELLHSWIGCDLAVESGVADAVEGGVIYHHDVVQQLASMIELRCNSTKLADYLKGVPPQEIKPAKSVEDMFNETFRAATPSCRGVRVFGGPAHLVAIALPSGQVLKRSDVPTIPVDAESWQFRNPSHQACSRRFFSKHAASQRMTNLGLSALSIGNLEALQARVLFPDTSSPCSSKVYNRRLSRLRREAALGDAVFVRDTTSLVSSAIAKIDAGSWSHVTIYLHDGWILDTQTEGTSLRRLEEYAKPSVRMGLYRLWPEIPAAGERALLEYASSNFHVKYDWLGAIKAGLKAILSSGHSVNHTEEDGLTPNGVIYSGAVRPICFV